jgi:LPS sulfotransferase NodH
MTRYTELQISSDILDQPAFSGEPRKIFICSTPRTGSYLLCRYMINAGLGVPHEYFNPFVINQIAPRIGLDDASRKLSWRPRGRKDRLGLRRAERDAEQAFLERYLETLAPRRCQGGVFAAKIHFRDFRQVLDNPVGHRLLDGGLFVYLYREDLLSQAVSEHFGQLTGRWGIDDAVTTPPAPGGDFFDVAAIDRAVKDLSEQERGWRVFLARSGASPMSISYEKLCEDPFSFVAAIARRVGVDPATLRRGYSETAAQVAGDAHLPSKAEAARRYLAAVHGLKEPRVRGLGLAVMRRLLGGERGAGRAFTTRS